MSQPKFSSKPFGCATQRNQTITTLKLDAFETQARRVFGSRPNAVSQTVVMFVIMMAPGIDLLGGPQILCRDLGCSLLVRYVINYYRS